MIFKKSKYFCEQDFYVLVSYFTLNSSSDSYILIFVYFNEIWDKTNIKKKNKKYSIGTFTTKKYTTLLPFQIRINWFQEYNNNSS